MKKLKKNNKKKIKLSINTLRLLRWECECEATIEFVTLKKNRHKHLFTIENKSLMKIDIHSYTGCSKMIDRH
jgi:hypothetical protein